MLFFKYISEFSVCHQSFLEHIVHGAVCRILQKFLLMAPLRNSEILHAQVALMDSCVSESLTVSSEHA